MTTLSLLLGAALLAAPGDSLADERRLSAYRLTPATGAPTIDGRLDDAVWAAADSIHGFTQREPEEGQPARFATVVRVAFDDEAVYVAARAYDPEPGKIVAQLTRRDEGSSSDWLLFAFDSRHDQRTAYVFAVNPAGVKRDFTVAEGQEDDVSWDAVWSASVQKDAQGWTAELRIPLAALRFSSGGDGVWGFQAVREVQRTSEQSWWAPMKRDEPRLVARFGELHGMRGLPAPRRLELLPYSLSGVTNAPGSDANPFYSANDLRGAVGLDLKYGVTSNLTLDATFNPDFGQVEADPSQVNLSTYETFLSEKRPFFTEGSEIFRFGIGLGDGSGSQESLFYSRRVGRSPQGGADGEYVQAPGHTNIIGAAKLSGRLPGGWSVGVLNALTAEERARIADGVGARDEVVVEPLTSYTVMRARRDLNGGRTQVGAVGTGVYRRLDGTGMDWLRSSAFAGGLDLSHQWGKNDAFRTRLWLLGSSVHGSEDAMVRAQTSSARYYQRADAGYVRVDSSATSMQGWSASWEMMKVQGRVQGGIAGSVRSPGFEVNDLGFQRNADEILNVGFLGLRQFDPNRVTRNANLNFNLWDSRNFGGQRLSLGGNVNGYAQLLSYWGVYGGIERAQEAFNMRATRGRGAILAPGGWAGWGGFHTDDRKALEGSVDFSWGTEDESGGWRYGLSAGVGWRVSPSLRVTMGPFYNRNHNDWQFLDNAADDAGAVHSVFGTLDQETFGLSARVNQTFSPTLSLQVYAQPFVAAGRFTDLKEVGDAHADRYDDRFGPAQVDLGEPAFNVRDFNLNAVLRWEYRLGSTLFFAWSHTRSASGDLQDGVFRPRRDFGELWAHRPTNVLMIKANWWVSM